MSRMSSKRLVWHVLHSAYVLSEPDYRVGGPGQFLLEGPYDVLHDVIVGKSYVFADSQGTRVFFLL